MALCRDSSLRRRVARRNRVGIPISSESRRARYRRSLRQCPAVAGGGPIPPRGAGEIDWTRSPNSRRLRHAVSADPGPVDDDHLGRPGATTAARYASRGLGKVPDRVVLVSTTLNTRGSASLDAPSDSVAGPAAAMTPAEPSFRAAGWSRTLQGAHGRQTRDRRPLLAWLRAGPRPRLEPTSTTIHSTSRLRVLPRISCTTPREPVLWDDRLVTASSTPSSTSCAPSWTRCTCSVTVPCASRGPGRSGDVTGCTGPASTARRPTRCRSRPLHRSRRRRAALRCVSGFRHVEPRRSSRPPRSESGE